MPANPRAQRVADRIQIELADILHRRLKDPRLGFVTVTAVEVSRDLRLAKVFVSTLPAEELDSAMIALEHAKGFLRTQMGQRIRLRHTPELHFFPDRSAEHGLRVQELLKELKDRGELDSPDEFGDEGGD